MLVLLLATAAAGAFAFQFTSGNSKAGTSCQPATDKTFSVNIPPPVDGCYCSPPSANIHTGQVPKPGDKQMSLDDLPVTGGDGSFWLKTGRYAIPMPNLKTVASHSHPVCHTFWMIDRVNGTKYSRRAIKLPEGSSIGIELEQAKTTFPAKMGTYVAAGTVLISHRNVDGLQNYKSGEHKVSDGWAWYVDTGTTNFITRNEVNAAADQFRPVAVESRGEQRNIRIKNIHVKMGNSNDRMAIRASSGCVAFQVCAFGECKPMAPPCDKEGQGGTYSDVAK